MREREISRDLERSLIKKNTTCTTVVPVCLED
jgi:hypothetical protein